MTMSILLWLCLWLWPGVAAADPQASAPPESPTPASTPEVRFPYYTFPNTVSLCGETVPLQERDVWEALDREFVITVWSRAQTTMWLKRAHRYFPELEKKLKAKHLPLDLKYVALAESDLRQEARSQAGAMGPWQFMGPTAQRFQLKVTSEVDDRLDFASSTDAALEYLKKLHQKFGKWSLALAAYNCGEGRVQKEIDSQRVDNYYHLALPEETERYVFRIIAAKIVMESPRTYGFDIPAGGLYEPLENDQGEAILTQEVMVRSLAAACGTYYKAFKDMNPWIKGNSLPPGTYRFKLPKGSAGSFADAQRSGKLEPKIMTPAPNKPKP